MFRTRIALLVTLLVALSSPVIAAVMLSAPAAGASPAAWTAYTVNSGSNTVSAIDTATNTVVGSPIAVGALPVRVAITPDGTTAYVANESSNTVSVIATATNTVVTSISVGTTPDAVAISPDGTTAYVVNVSSNTVSVIATATNTVVTTIPVGSSPIAVAISPDGASAYVTNSVSNTISVIATATDTVVATIPVGTAPRAVAITPNGTTAYVANTGDDTVSVIATATATVVATITVGTAPRGLAISPDGTTAYVANTGDDTVSVIATATDTVVATITVGTSPFGVAISPDGATAYVTNETSNTVSVIATATDTVVATITVGATPLGIAITPDQAPVASFSVSPAPAGQATTFDASASTVAFGTIASYAWSFGDGTTATTTTPIINHIYASPGTFTANVTETSSGGTSTTQVFTGQTMSRNGGRSASATTAVIVAAPPSIAKAFSPTAVPLNGTSTLTFTLTNPNGGTVLTGVAFTDALPSGLVVSTPNGLTNSCGGTASASAGGATISLTGASVAASTTCTVVVSVTGTMAGTFTNTTGAVSSTNGGTGNTATAVLTVAAVVPAPGPTTTTTTTTAPGPVPPFPHSNVSYPNAAIVTFRGAHYVFAGGRAFAASANELAAVQKVDHAQVLAAPAGASAPTAVAPRPGVTVFTHPVDGNVTIYVVGVDGELHPFATPTQFLRDGYNGALVITVPNLGGLTVGSNAGTTLTALATRADGAIVNSSGTFYTFAGGRAFGIPTPAALQEVRKTNSALELQGSVSSADTGAPMANGIVLSVAGPVYVSYLGELYPFKTKAQLASSGYGGTPAVPAPHTGGLTVVFPYSGS
jgi:YVTN family beta-propeller protein